MRYAAVIAAAGLSSRMHEFKPLLCINDSTVIENVITRLQQAGVDEIVVVAGYKADILEKHLAPLGIRVCKNPDYAKTKMFDSLCLGIRALKQPYDRLFLTPGDVPLVQAETLRQMQASSAPVIRPVYQEKSGHPVLIQADLVPKLLAHNGKEGLCGALASLQTSVLDIEVDDIGITLDADTPEDFRILRRQAAEQRSGGRLWPDLRIHVVKGDTVLKPETAQFLEMIEHTGSIQNACACVHMSYSRGWRLLRDIEQELGYPLVQRFSGGAQGGGSYLTDQAKALLKAYQEFREELKEVAEALFLKKFPDSLHGSVSESEDPS